MPIGYTLKRQSFLKTGLLADFDCYAIAGAPAAIQSLYPTLYSERAVAVMALTAALLQMSLLVVQSLGALLRITWRAVAVLPLTAVPLQVCLLAVQSLDALLRLAVTRQELAATVQGMPEPDPAAGTLEVAEGAWL